MQTFIVRSVSIFDNLPAKAAILVRNFWRNTKKHPYYILAFLVSALLVYAAINKLIIFPTFIKQLEAAAPFKKFFPGNEHTYAVIVAVIVPLLELLIPAGFFFKRTRIHAFWSSFGLMVLFTIYAYAVPHHFPGLQTCSCGGIISQLSWKGHFIMNLIFSALAATGWIWYEYLQTKRKKANTKKVNT